MEIDHLMAESQGGPTVEENLWLACSQCNKHKAARVVFPDPDTGELVRLFSPRYQAWKDHFSWSEDGLQIIALTQIGAATVAALNLNREVLVIARERWIQAGWHPPTD